MLFQNANWKQKEQKSPKNFSEMLEQLKYFPNLISENGQTLFG